MASASVGAPACTAPVPELLSAVPGNSQVSLSWQSGTGAVGYRVYYDQAGKSVFIFDTGSVASYIDSGLTNGSEYCYKVSSYDAACESGFSNVLCTVPTNQGQATLDASVTTLATGAWSGKGANQTFTVTSTFTAGDTVTIQATVVDQDGQPLPGATVDLLITGPESLVITSGTSDANGIAEATWNTKAAKGKSAGTTPGTYTASTKGISANGYSWDGVATSATFTIQ
jgi:hypothetical protein